MWTPQRGAQEIAWTADWCDELFYGGERGGGKSDLQIGWQEDGALTYGKHWRGVMFRKTYPEMEELQARAMEVFPGEGAVFKTQQSAEYPFSSCWYWPNGATVKMRYIENDKDYGRYHGHQYCVGVGTPILMADGSWRPIENLAAGDLVQTLEGAKAVLATVAPYLAPCVKVTTRLGSQLQPTWHPVLTSVAGTSESPRDESQSGAQLQPPSDPWQSAESLCGARRSSRAICASSADGRSGSEASDGVRQVLLQRPRLTFQAVLYELDAQSSNYRCAMSRRGQGKYAESSAETCRPVSTWTLSGLARLAARARQVLGRAGSALSGVLNAHAPCGRPESAEALGYPARCPAGCRCGGAQPRVAQGCGQSCVPSPGDAASPSRAGCHTGGTGCTPSNSRQELGRYIHPYTKEQRPLTIPAGSGSASVEWFGSAYVCDLTIEDANHYITRCGLINKNTGISFDEVTEYATPAGLLKMLSTLRSAHGVPCRVRLTGNPGGVGHVWVKARYITPAAPLAPFTDPETGFTRMFVPSRMADNQILMVNDPGYRKRILAATGGNAALRQAWLEGNWDIVAGAFFDNITPAIYLPRWAPPQHWTRFRSFDWGSAKPFSCGWWAIADDDHWLTLRDGSEVMISRGAIVRYREWYGCKEGEPNVGLKITAEAVGRGILQREYGEKIDESLSVADPSLWKEDGGQSLAERMLKCDPKQPNALVGPRFRPADNTRVAGWQQMRARIGGAVGEPGSETVVPMLYVTEDCLDWRRTVPAMQHDKNRLEDVDSDGEDHAGDETRYACMARPLSRVPKGRQPTGPRPFTLEWVMAQK